ncbi:ankyrin repeat-containing domain protein [Stachybotrys elegans]|uniref:Ankyrin repeat-containing domain protein n=1 Tax=Stachybotrys elegans TaxID=80388 RepID=A0A8K0SFG9_9HYPO|nr:ankyrin repeat-containing domain protein [Stachybotrys elegans]
MPHALAEELPIELWLAVAENLPISDLAALCLVHRKLQHALTPLLYKRAATSLYDKRALFWGVLNGLQQTVEHALAAGIDPNLTWRSLARADELSLDFYRSQKPSRKDLHGSRKPSVGLSEFLDAIGNRNAARPGLPLWNWSALHLATLNGHVPIIELLLDHKAGPTKGSLGLCSCDLKPRTVGPRPQVDSHDSESESSRWTAFHVAVCCGQLSAAKTLPSRGIPLAMEASDRSSGVTALHVACMSGHLPVVKWLVERGEAIDVVDGECQTPLVYAYLYEHWDCFEYLLGHGANIHHVVSVNLGEDDHEDWIHQTMLYSAIDTMRLEDACRLVDLGASIDKVDASNPPLIVVLCRKPWSTPKSPKNQDEYGLRLLDSLLPLAPRADGAWSGNTPLEGAASTANHKAVKRLLDAGEDVNGYGKGWASPLARACHNVHRLPILETVSLFLDAGADVNRPGETILAPLWALEMDHCDPKEKEDVSQLLIDRGANLARGTSSSSGVVSYTTPLERQLKQGNLAEFKRLLALCGPNPMDKLGEDDFLGFWRAVFDSEDTVAMRYVLDLDKDKVIARRDRFALSSLFSYKPMPTDVILQLLDQGADVKADSFSLPYLIQAITYHVEPVVLEKLLSRGADPYQEWENMTPLHYMLSHELRHCTHSLEYTRVFLEAGVSIYREIRYEAVHPTQSPPPTVLVLAIEKFDKGEEIVELMLQKQPLHQHKHGEIKQYLRWACGVGNWRALQAMMASDEVKQAVKEECSILLQHALDGLRMRQYLRRHMEQTVSLVQFLLQQGPDLSVSGEDPRQPGTTRAKLLGLLSNEGWRQTDPSSWCFHRRMEFTEDQDMPVFKDVAPDYTDATTLVGIRKRLEAMQAST